MSGQTQGLPRCEDCRFWQRRPADAGMGGCLKLNASPGPDLAALHLTGALLELAEAIEGTGIAVAPALLTRPDFGCVLWEARR